MTQSRTDPDATTAIDDAIAHARARWPGLAAISSAELRAHITSKAAADHLPELVLAIACARGDRAALAALERDFIPRLDGPIRRTGTPPDEVDEVLQRLREDLLVDRAGTPAKIRSYLGSGPLSAWLRVCAVRRAVNHRRRRRGPDRGDDGLIDRLAATDHDLERIATKGDARGEVREAFSTALAALPPRLANVLRHRVLDGLNSQEIAGLYGVHRATVDRWLVHAKQAVVDRTRARLEATLGLDSTEARSLIRLVASRLDLSMSGLLQAEGAR